MLKFRYWACAGGLGTTVRHFFFLFGHAIFVVRILTKCCSRKLVRTGFGYGSPPPLSSFTMIATKTNHKVLLGPVTDKPNFRLLVWWFINLTKDKQKLMWGQVDISSVCRINIFQISSWRHQEIAGKQPAALCLLCDCCLRNASFIWLWCRVCICAGDFIMQSTFTSHRGITVRC